MSVSSVVLDLAFAWLSRGNTDANVKSLDEFDLLYIRYPYGRSYLYVVGPETQIVARITHL